MSLKSSNFVSSAFNQLSNSFFFIWKRWAFNPGLNLKASALVNIVTTTTLDSITEIDLDQIRANSKTPQKPQKVKKIKMNSHSKVTDQTPIFIDSSPALSPMAEEMEISMLLTPPGYSIYDGDCFTQPEFDALFAFVMNQITIYCRDNYPKNFLEHEARVKLYMDVSRGFKFANVHNLIPKYEDGMPHGSSLRIF
ncbi:hypothetical protein PGT21_032470 [Puccinia graminis f. sp. tritici]|uniref:Uncharacterized protein n=1 Tax=Puccinia graminis f. sp. tritici TaxID=56615 RepID=A0A5B0R5K9_PUCGR|nr:hypothetical protein PGT21_032470 [Puccinia graminis f. sp. tritici]KAA1120593.1 hypothetical protein PGTUg99_004181 [Puccinia graminis f. sp. tritici]